MKIIHAFSNKMFNKGFDSHYTGIEIYPSGYDSTKDRLYLQRNRRTKELTYFRIDLSVFGIGFDNIGFTLSGGKIERFWWSFRIGKHWFENPIKIYKKRKALREEHKRIQAMLDSGQYSMDPMGVIHHIDDDQAKYYE